MLGFSFGEIMVISLVALVAVGPQKLPGMLKTMGQWVRKLRQMTMDVRQQTGIDEMLRAEGIQLSELRSLMRGYHAPVAPTPAPVVNPTPAPVAASSSTRYEDPYGELEPDPTREYPLEGADAYGALPDDLLEPGPSAEAAPAPGPPLPPEEPIASAAPPEPAASAPEPAASAPEPAASAPEPAASASEPAASASEPAASAPEPAAEPPSASAPAAAPPRSVPPPPPSRAGVPRPSSAPPPPPRRASAPPRPESSSPPTAKPESTPAGVPPRSGNVNGSG
ncbi:MAG: hypothetical protein EOO73_31685 [Myxococcales bacterium]|nr:MAG: hypothetical protein EOO73_31685 [Myxococcales bacterium]